MIQLIEVLVYLQVNVGISWHPSSDQSSRSQAAQQSSLTWAPWVMGDVVHEAVCKLAEMLDCDSTIALHNPK